MVRKSERRAAAGGALEHPAHRGRRSAACLLGLRRLLDPHEPAPAAPVGAGPGRAAHRRGRPGGARARARARRDRAVSRRVQRHGRAARRSTARARSASCLQAQQRLAGRHRQPARPGAGPERRRAAAAREPRGRERCSGSSSKADGSGAARPRWSPRPGRRDAGAPARRRPAGAPTRPGGFDEARAPARRRTGTGMSCPGPARVYAEDGADRRRDVVLQDVTRLLRFDELQEQPGRHGRARVPHAPHVAAAWRSTCCLEQAVGPLTDKQADLALRGARGLRAPAGDRRRPARSVAHPGGPDRASARPGRRRAAREGGARRPARAGHPGAGPASSRGAARRRPGSGGRRAASARVREPPHERHPPQRARRRGRASRERHG